MPDSSPNPPERCQKRDSVINVRTNPADKKAYTDAAMKIRVTPAEKERFTKAGHGNLSSFVRSLLDKASKKFKS